MRGISFQYTQPLTPADPNRMDIACFAGFVHRPEVAAVPAEVSAWLARHRWLQRAEQDNWAMLDVPVPIESWESFEQLFAWKERLDSPLVISSGALPDAVSIDVANRLFKLVINGEAREILLDIADYTPQELADFIDAKLADMRVTVEHYGSERFLNFEYTGTRGQAQVTIFTQPLLGFAAAVSQANAHRESYLGSAVKAFFAQGGRKCYVIRMGDPLPQNSSEAQRVQQLGRLLRGDSAVWPVNTLVSQLVASHIPAISLSQERPDSWHGIEHLLGLEDVSYLNLPDLPELVGLSKAVPARETITPEREVFVECSEKNAAPRVVQVVAELAPRCDHNGYRVWARVLQTILRFMRNMMREVHLIASLPLADDSIAEDPKTYILEALFGTSDVSRDTDIRSAFLQLAYPWLLSSQSEGLPQRALPPDGVLTGMLAANALGQGVFNSAAGNKVLHAYDLFPVESFTPSTEGDTAHSRFYRHVSVFARIPGAIQLISDVTASHDESYRPAVVSRLMALVLRAARHQGRSTLFEPMSHATWRAVEKSLSTLLLSIYNAGGLRGRTQQDAFTVQCDATTMTRNDIDSGRLIANVSFQPAIPVQRIQVAIALQHDGQVELRGAA